MSSSLFSRLFPIPAFFTLPTIGLDFSDATMRFVKLKESKNGIIPAAFAELSIPAGCIKGGRIDDEKKFIEFLRSARKKYSMKYVRVSIPESQVYSFTVPIDAIARKDIRGAIELVLEDNIPLKVTETIFDYHVFSSDEKTITVQVVALSEKIAQEYLDAFTAADLVPVSFELDAQAAVRAVLPPEDTRSCMIVDFGANRTGITIVTNHIAVYTSSLDFGGMSLISEMMHDISLPLEEVHRLVHTYGLTGDKDHEAIGRILSKGVAKLKEEISRRYVYWHERKDQLKNIPPIDTVYLCGGYSTIEGLSEYLASGLKLKVVHVNPWINCFSFDKEIPIIAHKDAQSYVTAIGLALADYIYD